MPLIAGALLLLLPGLLACADRTRQNPLDPEADAPDRWVVRPLQALAGDGEVRLTWDYTYYRDISGYYLYRRETGANFRRHPDRRLAADTTEYTDLEVSNGVEYEYRLDLVVEGEGQRSLEITARATPAPAPEDDDKQDHDERDDDDQDHDDQDHDEQDDDDQVEGSRLRSDLLPSGLHRTITLFRPIDRNRT